MFKKFMSKKPNKKRGFTLIELIIVIAIIAILAAIAVPAFGNISQKAKVNTDIANARTIYSVLTAAVAEGDTKVPTASTAAPIPTISGLDNKIKSKAISGTFAYTLNTTGDIVIYVDPADGSANVQIYPNGSAPYSD